MNWGSLNHLQSYITQIQEISDTGLFSFADNNNPEPAILQAQRYATALKDVDAAQAALLLSTQGLANAQTTILTSKKLAELVESHKLTMAQAEEIAVRASLTLSLKTQSSVMPKWIATLKAATLAVRDQVKATGVWLATTPAGWVTSAIIAVASFTGILNILKKQHSEAVEKIRESAETARASIDSLNSAFQDTKTKAESALQTYNKLADGIDLLSNKNLSLSDDDYKEFLNTNNELASVFPELVKYYDTNGNAILNLGDNATAALSAPLSNLKKFRLSLRKLPKKNWISKHPWTEITLSIPMEHLTLENS